MTDKRGFFVGVISCAAWCAYNAYYVMADTPGQARDRVRKEHFPNFKPEQLTIKIVEIVDSEEVTELDELDVVG